MAGKSGIEWTEQTWNPLVGCSKVSEGCKHCYAEVMARRLAAMPGTSGLYRQVVHGAAAGNGLAGKWNGAVVLNEKALEEPLRRKKPTMYFVNSMSDLFHESVSWEVLERVFGVMASCPQHVFQVLTKRPERMRACMKARAVRGQEVLPNVWLGVSVENQAAADARVPVLLHTDAAVRFVSCEPLLGAVDLGPWLVEENARKGAEPQRKPKLDWVIVGGESGHGAGVRPMHPDWARGIRDACVRAKVPFFFKQWGEWLPYGQAEALRGAVMGPGARLIWRNGVEKRGGVTVGRVGKKAAGRELDGRVWEQMPVGRGE